MALSQVGGHNPLVNALQVSRALARALGIRFGEVTLQIAESDATIVRAHTTLKPRDLAEIEVPLEPGPATRTPEGLCTSCGAPEGEWHAPVCEFGP